MWKRFRSKIQSQLYQLPGWHTSKKIVVIESDDWGAYRMYNKRTRDKLEAKFKRNFSNPYDRLDCLEQNEDFSQLLEVLDGCREYGSVPLFTVNTIMANPDFQKIEDSKFQDYYFKPITECYAESARSYKVLDLVKEGVDCQLLKTQFHGREHVQVQAWLRDLQKGRPEVRTAFDHGVYSISSKEVSSARGNYMAAYDYQDSKGLRFVTRSIIEGLQLFRHIFGFHSASAIPPAAVWDTTIERIYRENHVLFLQGFVLQYITGGERQFKKLYHYTGEENNFGQLYLTRNCYFEPSTNPKIDWVNKCLKQIERSFILKKPAIISSHRINYVGGIEKSNRDNNLAKLKTLLSKIYQHWPDVWFLSSDELGRMIQKAD